ncbi:ABC transporter ATP-binding protein [Companilactobacillus zhachilii]|jgi:ABC-type antimicrobial peptide transport system, ATPase component|uniref:ABC transporter ATP-binding protein n=1 Tax=Companilactobacillus zhachilii TaxID=2304606 RepID=UPI001923E5A9|nr:ABC transporter ATP-binding protein [Companilactobacillus zhachilii]MBL3530045.1 ABC transporter ATP-binding protein [Companilactobacillus zhachilii]
MDDAIIEADSVSKSFSLGKNKSIDILKDISFTAYSNEFLSIVGPSGSGKSTLLKCVSGLLEPTTGLVKVNALNPYLLSPAKIAKMRRTEIGFIFQSYNLVPALPVLENIVLPLRLSGKKISNSKVEALLNSMNFSADLGSFVNTLSGGEQQKVAIARVLVTNAEIIFADEPTGAVDENSKELIFNTLRKLADNGACVVMVTHDIDLASKTDRALILKDGKLVKVLNKPDTTGLLEMIEKG